MTLGKHVMEGKNVMYGMCLVMVENLCHDYEWELTLSPL